MSKPIYAPSNTYETYKGLIPSNGSLVIQKNLSKIKQAMPSDLASIKNRNLQAKIAWVLSYIFDHYPGETITKYQMAWLVTSLRYVPKKKNTQVESVSAALGKLRSGHCVTLTGHALLNIRKGPQSGWRLAISDDDATRYELTPCMSAISRETTKARNTISHIDGSQVQDPTLQGIHSAAQSFVAQNSTLLKGSLTERLLVRARQQKA